jgi:hypothetical protein
MSSRIEIYLDDTEISQFDKEAVDIKFDTVEGFLLVDQILHRKTQTFEVRHSKYTSGTSRIGMRVSEGPPPLSPIPSPKTSILHISFSHITPPASSSPRPTQFSSSLFLPLVSAFQVTLTRSTVRDLGIFKPLTLNEKKYQARSTTRQEMESQGRFYLNIELYNIDGDKLFAQNNHLTTGSESLVPINIGYKAK